MSKYTDLDALAHRLLLVSFYRCALPLLLLNHVQAKALGVSCCKAPRVTRSSSVVQAV